MPKGIEGRTNLCSKCNKVKEIESKRYCRICAAEWMRLHRKKYSEYTPQQKIKAAARAKIKMRIKRGKIIRGSCEVCGNKKAEAHHDDYSKPYDVRWLCFFHHREHHKNVSRKAINVSRKTISEKKLPKWLDWKGEKHPTTILDENKGREIRKLLKNGVSYRELKNIYKVSAGAISGISMGKTWKHVV